MRFDVSQQNIWVTARELAEIAVRHRGACTEDGFPRRLNESERFAAFGTEEGTALLAELEHNGRKFIAHTLADFSYNGIYAFGFASPTPFTEGELRLCRAEAFLSAWILCKESGRDSVRIRIYTLVCGESSLAEETVRFFDLCAMAKRAFTALEKYAEEELDRITRRLPSMKSAPFPFPAARPGQKGLMQLCFSAIRHAKTVFASAPTGTGKTVSTLYPAVRAIGAGNCDKVFYFTPKNTSALQAEDTVRRLREAGVLLRAIRLVAKEKLCRAIGGCALCRDCHFSQKAEKKLAAVSLALYNGNAAIPTEEALLAAARENGLCPYELSLACAERADVVICDYNYLFDPAVALRRFFTEDAGRRYAALVDEAHNLPARAREIFSASITQSALALNASLCPERVRPYAEALLFSFRRTVSDLLKDDLRKDKDGNEVGFASQSNLPTHLINDVQNLVFALCGYCEENRARQDDEMREVWRIRREAEHLLSVCENFDGHYVLWALREGGEDTLSLFCIDPSPRLRERASLVKSCIYFSATLSPIEYYRDLLGGDRTSLLETVPSPFDPENLSITVMDSVSTRYSEREETLTKVVKVIIETMRGKVGNYMVFCPSFRYMEAVASLFCRVAPKVACVVQRRGMSRKEQEEFLAEFRAERRGHLVGFCVMGGIYAEGIDLAGDRLIGAVVVGVGIPQISPENEMISAYYQSKSDEGKEYAYLYPGLNRVLQAAGRVIRREDDRGVLVLIDERFRDPLYRKIFPTHWRQLRYAGDLGALKEQITRFWADKK